MSNDTQDKSNSQVHNTQAVNTEEKTSPLSPSQAGWILGLEKLIAENAGNSLLCVEWLSSQMSLSRRQLLRRTKTFTGLTPQEYIMNVKLAKAKHLLEHETYKTVKAVAAECGFTDVAYFSTLFKKKFGKSPSELLKYFNHL